MTEQRWFKGKTGWNWLPLLIQVIGAIAVPLAIGIGLYQFTVQQQHDLAITADLQHQTTLQNYLDQMSDLLLKENLRASKQGDVVRQIAEVQTLTALQNLDPTRKGILVRFMYESGLIFYIPADKTSPIINLNTADLRTADMRGFDLHGADLSGADLEGTSLRGANLSSADLSRANLSRADLSSTDMGGAILRGAFLRGTVLRGAFLRGIALHGADLSDADLSDADLFTAIATQKQLNEAKTLKNTIMPDGTKHP